MTEQREHFLYTHRQSMKKTCWSFHSSGAALGIAIHMPILTVTASKPCNSFIVIVIIILGFSYNQNHQNIIYFGLVPWKTLLIMFLFQLPLVKRQMKKETITERGTTLTVEAMKTLPLTRQMVRLQFKRITILGEGLLFFRQYAVPY